MGQLQAKKSNVDVAVESKSCSPQNTTGEGVEETESCGVAAKDASNDDKRGIFARLRKSHRERAPGTKSKDHNISDDSMESIYIGPDLNGSRQSLEQGEVMKESEGSGNLPSSMMLYKYSEESRKSFETENINSRLEQGNSCRTDAKDVSFGPPLDPSLGDRRNDGGDFKVGENEESSCPKEVLLEDRDFVEKQLRELETPMKWLQDLISKEGLTAGDFSEASSGTSRGKRAKWQEDHFRVTTHHLWLSARHCLLESNLQMALKEMSMSEIARVRFTNSVYSQETRKNTDKWSSKAQRGDEDVVKALSLVIGNVEAVIFFRLGKISDASRLLKLLKEQNVPKGVRAALMGVKASVVACAGPLLPAAVEFAREATELAPDYWRWHSLSAVLLHHRLEGQNPARVTAERREAFQMLETACRLEPRNAQRALVLADAYRNAAFWVRKRRELDSEFKEYSRKAVSAYEATVRCAPKCLEIHASAAHGLWKLRQMRPDASQKAMGIAGGAMRMLTDGDELAAADGYGRDRELEGQADAALSLGMMWESAGKLERAQCLFRMAATNPLAPANVAYRAELGIITSNFSKGKFYNGKNKNPKLDLIQQLDKLMEKFSDSEFQQLTLCHKGHYLLDVIKDNSAALDAFCKAVNIRPRSQILQRYYPKFNLTHSPPLRIADVIHELACKELSLIQVRASKGSPEAIRRADQLNEKIQLAQEMNMAQNLMADNMNRPRNEDVSYGPSDVSPRSEICLPSIEDELVKQGNGSDVSPRSEICLPSIKDELVEQENDSDVSPRSEICLSSIEDELVEQEKDRPEANHEAEDTLVEKQLEECVGNDSGSIEESIISVSKPDEEEIGDGMNITVDHLIPLFEETAL